jgi:hypothetical protein
MKNLVMGILMTAALGPSTGCIITSGGEPEGRFGLSWELLSDSALVSCAEAGAVAIGVYAQSNTSGVEFIDDRSILCSNQSATTALFPEDDYSVVVAVLDETGASLHQSLPLGASIFDASVTELGLFAFEFGASGSITFDVEFGDLAVPNCATTSGGLPVEFQFTAVFRPTGEKACLALPSVVDGQPDLSDICAQGTECVEVGVPQRIDLVLPGTYDLWLDGARIDGNGDPVICYSGIVADVSVLAATDTDLGTIRLPLVGDPSFCE